MADTRLSTTRRAILTAALALPAATIAAGLPTAALANTADRSAWDQAFSLYERAKAASDADYAAFSKLHDAWTAAVDAIPHVQTSATFQSGIGGHRAMATTNPDDLASARRMLSGLREWGSDMDEYVTACRELIAADEGRAAARADIDRRFGINDAAHRSDDLSEQQSDAQTVLIQLPAPDADALRWKLNYLFGEESNEDGYCASWSADFIRPVIADVNRLLANGRA